MVFFGFLIKNRGGIVVYEGWVLQDPYSVLLFAAGIRELLRSSCDNLQIETQCTPRDTPNPK